MFRYANPYYFFLIIPTIVAIWFIYRRHTRAGILFAPTSRLAETNRKTWRMHAANILPILYIVGLMLCIFALARPQTVFSTNKHSADVIAIEMTVDVSGSMDALDMSTAGIQKTRLYAVKEAFAEFLSKRPDDLIGIITFGGYASTRAPLTTDHGALLHILKGVETAKPGIDDKGQIIDREETQTAIGDALATACARLEKAKPKSKIIVLLSDGESNTGIITPQQATELAMKMDIKVYTIGVGSTGNVRVQYIDMRGRKRTGHQFMRLDEKLLKNIASSTGGEYFNVRNPRGLEKALNNISKLETTKIERDSYEMHNELFPWFLGIALLLIMTGTTLNMMIVKRII